MIQVSRETIITLTELESLAQSRSPEENEVVRQQLVDEFLPLVELLAEAGLFMVSVPGKLPKINLEVSEFNNAILINAKR